MPLEDLQAHTPSLAGEPHTLRDHLTRTSRLAEVFASRFGLGQVGELVGAWHDLGKAHPNFQSYLKAIAGGGQGTSEPHAIWGAAVAYGLRAAGGPWQELTLPIAGHHAGLKAPQLLANEVEQLISDSPELVAELQALALQLPFPAQVAVPTASVHDRELRIRMLLSILVDADRLDTEHHFNPQRSQARHDAVKAARLWSVLQDDQRRLQQGAEPTTVNQIRAEVYNACVEAAPGPRGIYRLRVPTGGGKTRSSLSFALRHAQQHDLERVIVAIPYTSIIDQTAAVYRSIFGNRQVLEHHSRVEWPENEAQDPSAYALRLSTENWDSPLVVTTTVQLFESLFSHHPSAVRKLHRLANSVIILDEVQTLPPSLLAPTLDVLRALVESYGVTLVLSTATQPALEGTPFVTAFDRLGITELVPDFSRHFHELKRVDYVRIPGRIERDRLAKKIREERQGLVILNTRRAAVALSEALGEAGHHLHLSTLLCPAHRKDVLEEVVRRLEEDLPVLLVSTQVVEAGVDLDFPVVFRSLGPLDRIVQAAGRCNREGGFVTGHVYLFEMEGGVTPGGAYRTGLGHARDLLRDGDLSQLHDPSIFHEYFARLFRDQNLDEREIQSLRSGFRYRETSQRYRLIDEDTVPVLVDYASSRDGAGLRDRLREWRDRPSRTTLNRLQPYMVNVRSSRLDALRRERQAVSLSDRLYLWEGTYDARYGLREGLS